MTEVVTKEQVEWLASVVQYLAVKAKRASVAPRALQIIEAMWSEIESARQAKNGEGP